MTSRFKNIPKEFIDKLKAYNDNVVQYPKSTENISKLNQKNVLTVVSGQQVGLFINPVLALYKAIAAVKYASYLEEKNKTPVVPIFWLQTEDHDYEEIRKCNLLNRENTKVELNLEIDNRKVPIGLKKVGVEIEKLIAECELALGDYQFKNETLELIRNSYQTNSSFGLSFAKLISQMFPNSGLVFLDPTQCEVSKFSKQVYKTALNQFNLIAKTLKESPSQQVALRDNATLFFFRSETERERLISSAEGKFTNDKGQIFTISDLEQILILNPEKFSASALLRPLVQDYILPTVAYLGGQAEIEYLKQSEKLYPIFKEQVPDFIKRPSFTVLDRKSKNWLSELKLEVKDLNLKQEEFSKLLATKILSQDASPKNILDNATMEINTTFDKIENSILHADQTLINSAKKARQKSLESINLLVDKYSKAALSKEQIWLERLNKIRAFCFPDGIKQERALSAIYFYAKFGSKFTDEIYNTIDTNNLSKDVELII